MIPLSTWARYDRAGSAMASLGQRAETLNAQIASGKRLSTASDDAIAYQRLRGLKTASADDAAYAGNVAVAQGVLQQADTALGAIADRLARVKEIVVAAGNPTIDAVGRNAYAIELDGILADVLSLASQNDPRGQKLFGGAVTATAGAATFAPGAIADIPIGDGQQVTPSASAESFLKVGDDDVVSTLTAMAEALRTETGPLDTAGFEAVADAVDATRASLGARGARVDLQAAQLTAQGTDREAVRSKLEDTDVTAAITELQKTMTVLQATQASFSKLSSLSLFDYLR